MMVRYYGWYSNKMRDQRRKRAEEAQEEAACESAATETIERGQLIIEPWFDDPMTRSERRIANDTDPVHAKRSNSAIQTSLLYCVEAIRAFLHMQRDSAVTIAAAAENLKERTIEKPRVFSAQCLPASVDLRERNG